MAHIKWSLAWKSYIHGSIPHCFVCIHFINMLCLFVCTHGIEIGSCIKTYSGTNREMTKNLMSVHVCAWLRVKSQSGAEHRRWWRGCTTIWVDKNAAGQKDHFQWPCRHRRLGRRSFGTIVRLSALVAYAKPCACAPCMESAYHQLKSIGFYCLHFAFCVLLVARIVRIWFSDLYKVLLFLNAHTQTHSPSSRELRRSRKQPESKN